MVALSYFTEETDLVKQHVSERDRKVKSTAADSAFPSVKDGGGVGWGGVGSPQTQDVPDDPCSLVLLYIPFGSHFIGLCGACPSQAP